MKLKTIHYQVCGLNYVYIQVPVSKTKTGEEFINLPMGVIETAIAKKMIEERVPIRGMEVIFLRKTLGMTLKNWASAFGLTAAGVLKWEKSTEIRLSKVNEAAVRAFVAETLDVEIEGTWSTLVAKKTTPKRLSLILKAA
jgi:DNA-binding transcriptional regulator YiaG